MISKYQTLWAGLFCQFQGFDLLRRSRLCMFGMEGTSCMRFQQVTLLNLYDLYAINEAAVTYNFMLTTDAESD